MTVDLTGFAADPVSDNPARVKELVDQTAALDDGVPFVLLPVRIETRFVQVEEPIRQPVTLGDLGARLDDSARVLAEIAAADLSTVRKGSASAFATYKADVENPMCDRVEEQLRAATASLRDAEALQRNPLDGEPAALDEVASAAAAVRGGLASAAASLMRLRSQWQLKRLQRELDAVARQAEQTLGTAETRTLPAARMRAALDVPDARLEAERLTAAERRRFADRAAPAPAPARVVRGDPAELAAFARTVPISNDTLTQAAATFETVLDGVRNLRGDPGAAPALAAAATTIALLPGAWKSDLLAAVDAAEAAGTVPAEDILALDAAIAAIRSDDPALDATVPRGDLIVTLPGPTQVVDQLLVRIYPDDIAVDTHEEALTDKEVDAGKAFWQQTTAAGSAEPALRAAWRALCQGRGSRRAAWVARIIKPPKPEPSAGTKLAERALAALATLERRLEEVAAAEPGKRFDALVRATQGLAKALARPRPIPEPLLEAIRARSAVVSASVTRLEALAERAARLDPEAEAAREQLGKLMRQIDDRIATLEVEELPPPVDPDLGPLKSNAWSRAATSGVLPGRFLVVAVANGQVAHAVAGAPVADDLKLSIDPDPPDPAAEEFRVDADGELVVGTSIRWMVDYDEALEKGMAVTLPLTPEEAGHGFDRIYVLGLRHGDAADGAQRLGELLDNHHYGHSGLGLLPVGTPTNNTESSPSGYRSLDDPDASFPLERGAALIDSAAPFDRTAADGLRLARALGVEPDLFAHVAGADGSDAADAQAVNAALYPATIGAALEEHAAPLISRDSRQRLQAFALDHVAARGLTPALRVGAQPYGLLPVTAYTRLVPDADEAGVAAADRLAQQRFDELMCRVLAQMAQDWAQIRDDNVAYATDPDVTDARAHFLKLLGLDAVSTTSSYRFAVNVAGRHGVTSGNPELQFGLPSQQEGAPTTGADFGPYALLARFQAILATAFGVDPNAALLDKGTVSAAYADVYSRLLDSRAYELRLLKQAHVLHGPVLGAHPAADLAALAAAPPAALAQQAAAGGGQQALLNLLVRQALLWTWRDAAIRILIGEGLVTEETVIEAGSSAHFVVPSLSAPAALTPWSYLFKPLHEVDRLQGTTSSGALYQYLQNGAVPMASFLAAGTAPTGVDSFDQGRLEPVATGVRGHAATVAQLGSIPAPRLEALVMEQLDLSSHRLDAWITGLAQRRLHALRNHTPVGAYVGAFGWVEELRPQAGHPLATNVPAALDGDPSRPIYHDPESEGFVHAPSVDHAVTAAILRSGYRSQRSETDVSNRMAVNLSSRRTRVALGLIDGVRAGNRFGALLGYRLERFLHEYYAGSNPPITLDAAIGPLRTAFPSAAGVDATLNPHAAARQVCDGLAIADAVTRWIAGQPGIGAGGRTVYDILSDGGHFTGHPWGLGQAVPPKTDPKLDGVVRAIDHVADAIDAVADLVVAEAVHQIGLGNHARAAAVVSALGEGRAPPRPEVVDTPRQGTALTHRILIQLADADGAPAGWEGIAMSARATAEPALNAWAARMLGPPGDLRLLLVHADDGTPAGEVDVSDLGLQAIDLVAILGPGLETGLGEIAARALDARRPADLDDIAPPRPLQVDLGRARSWGAEVRSLGEAAPLLEAMGAVIGRSRAANAQDYLIAEQAPAGGGTGVDTAELAARVGTARDELVGAGVALLRLLADDATLAEADLPADPRKFLAAQQPAPDPPRWAAREDWRTALLRAAALGITAALPPERYESRIQVRRALRNAAETAFVEIVQRLARAPVPDAGASESSLLGAARAIFGEGVALLPRAKLRDRPGLDPALAAKLASAAQIDGWLEGLAAVRESAAGLGDMLVLAEAHGAASPDASVVQLPHVDGEPWMGDRLPDGTQPQGRVSLAIFAPGSLPADGSTGVALLVDEWTEIVPSGDQTTGVAIHYDQPDSTPPQCVLVAVPPQRRQSWQLGELLQTLHDTFELAKSRAVELEHLQTTFYGQLLPLISGELVPHAVTGQTAGDDRVILDFGDNN